MGQRFGRGCGAAIMLASIVIARPPSAGAGEGSSSAVPTPTVSAPSEGTRGFPFPNTLQDLEDVGYLQEEFLVEGTARSYVADAPLADITDGRWDATATGPSEPYTTRLLVRRPAEPADFNGTVLVEWLNVSAGFDLDSFDSLGAQFVKDGYAYVGVSAQNAGVKFLKTWDPQRYATLAHPGDSYSYDIFSQVAQAIRFADPAPLGDLTDDVDTLIAWGGSQSGTRLFTYIDAVNPTTGVYDAFIPFITTGSTARAALSEAPLPDVVPPTGEASVVRTDTKQPVLILNSESEFLGSARGIHSQRDSKRFRLWEYAGTSHANAPQIEDGLKTLSANGIPVDVFPPCGDVLLNDVSAYPAWRAALQAVDRWVKDGSAPTKAPRVRMTIPDDPAQPATIQRDPATGIAKGGVQLPDAAVPIRTVTAERPAASLAEFPNCALFGAMDPWNGGADPWDGNAALDVSPDPEPSLAELYGTSAKYVKQVQKVADRLVDRGFLLPADARAIVKAARTAKIAETDS